MHDFLEWERLLQFINTNVGISGSRVFLGPRVMQEWEIWHFQAFGMSIRSKTYVTVCVWWHMNHCICIIFHFATWYWAICISELCNKLPAIRALLPTITQDWVLRSKDWWGAVPKKILLFQWKICIQRELGGKFASTASDSVTSNNGWW